MKNQIKFDVQRTIQFLLIITTIPRPRSPPRYSNTAPKTGTAIREPPEKTGASPHPASTQKPPPGSPRATRENPQEQQKKPSSSRPQANTQGKSHSPPPAETRRKREKSREKKIPEPDSQRTTSQIPAPSTRTTLEHSTFNKSEPEKQNEQKSRFASSRSPRKQPKQTPRPIKTSALKSQNIHLGQPRPSSWRDGQPTGKAPDVNQNLAKI